MTDSLSAVQRLIDDMAGTSSSQIDRIYQSANGDLWQLVREGSTGRVLVRHTSNAAAGGAVSDVSVEDFLATSGSGPEQGALRRLLETISTK